MASPFEQIASLCIGTIEFVSPDEIKVSLNIEAPESIALNAGNPMAFPKINNYLLVPNDEGYLVGQIVWLAIERVPYPKRKGTQKDFGLVDLPYPARKMSLNPVGILTETINIKNGNSENGNREKEFKFKRGVNTFPSVGDNVLLPTQKQLHAIIASEDNTPISIGVSPLADGAEVQVNPDRLFGRHLAVLGNTGSGKSCSVAGLIRWSLEAANKEIGKVKKTKEEEAPNARFIILDPNGEYSRAFNSDKNDNPNMRARVFQVDPDEGNEKLQVPLWFLNSAEWVAFTQASEKTQKPLLQQALRDVRADSVNLPEDIEDKKGDIDRRMKWKPLFLPEDIEKKKEYMEKKERDIEKKKLKFREYILTIYSEIKEDCDSGNIRRDATNFGRRLKTIADDIKDKKGEFTDYQEDLSNIVGKIEHALKSAGCSFTNDKGEKVNYYEPFKDNDIKQIVDCLFVLWKKLRDSVYQDGISDDRPIRFKATDLVSCLQILSKKKNIEQYVDTLIMRIQAMLNDTRIKSIMRDDSDEITLVDWLNDYIGKDEDKGNNITIIDLSLVPSEVIHIIISVVARVTFEALQRHRKIKNEILPTIIVMEEAHTFVKHYKDDAENINAATICCRAFEKIAREGRKFGLGLVISSQRPSELSPTVLSQCNTFLLHRISNDKDQDLVKRFIPENLKGLLGELPVLPSQQAILMGWASELPLLVKMNNLPKEHQPQSDDPDFWDVWTGKSERKKDWEKVANDWQGNAEAANANSGKASTN